MTELEFAIIKMLTAKNPVFEGEEMSVSAQSELMSQYLLYESIFKKITHNSSSGFNSLKYKAEFSNILKDIKSYFDEKKYQVKKRSRASGVSIMIESVIPVISHEDTDSILSILEGNQNNIRDSTTKAFSFFLLFGLRSEVFLRGGDMNNVMPSFANSSVTFYDTKYIALREIYLEADNDQVFYTRKTASFRSSLAEANAKFDVFNNEFSQQTTVLHSELAQLLNNHKDFEEKQDEIKVSIDAFNADLEGVIENSRSSIVNFEKSVNEHLKTSILGTFWLSRARWATAALCLSIVVICVLFGGATWAVFYFSDDIKGLITLKDLTDVEIGVLKDNVSGVVAFQLTRAFLLAVPVILYFWIIKLAVRFFMRSLLLMDDARQRNTIMQSYVQMVRDGAVDDKALAIIMWALCRSVPGHGPDGIEPPDFTEVLRAGSSLGKNPT